MMSQCFRAKNVPANRSPLFYYDGKIHLDWLANRSVAQIGEPSGLPRQPSRWLGASWEPRILNPLLFFFHTFFPNPVL
jgi:hypothetical protein